LDEAKKQALEFAKEHYPNFDKASLKLVKAELEDHTDDDLKGPYGIEWRQIFETELGEVKGPCWVSVSIDPYTGELFSYNSHYDETRVSVMPKITKEEAIDKVKEHLPQEGRSIRSMEEAALVITYKDKKQMLVWDVHVDGSFAPDSSEPELMIADFFIVRVDAFTGEIIKPD